MSTPERRDEDRASGTRLSIQISRVPKATLALLLMLALLIGACVGAVTRLQPNSYVSSVNFVVQTTAGANDTETLVRTFQALVTSNVIAADLLAETGVDLDPQELIGRLSVSRPPGAGVFTVAVSAADANTSRQLASKLIPVFQRRIGELAESASGAGAVEKYSVQTWGSGAVQTTTSAAPSARNALLGAGLALLLLALALAAYVRRHPRLTSPTMAAQGYGKPLLGALPVPSDNALSTVDAFRALLPLTDDVCGWPPNPRSLLVVSSRHVQDRGDLLLALADALEDRGDVVLVDADLRHGELTRLLGTGGDPVAAVPPDGSAALSSLVRVDATVGPRPGPPSQMKGTYLLPAGRGLGAEELAPTEALSTVVEEFCTAFTVVVDAGDMTASASWGPLLDTVEAVLLVTVLGRTSVREAHEWGDRLSALTDTPVAVLALAHDRFMTGARRAMPSVDLLPVAPSQLSVAPASARRRRSAQAASPS